MFSNTNGRTRTQNPTKKNTQLREKTKLKMTPMQETTILLGGGGVDVRITKTRDWDNEENKAPRTNLEPVEGEKETEKAE